MPTCVCDTTAVVIICVTVVHNPFCLIIHKRMIVCANIRIIVQIDQCLKRTLTGKSENMKTLCNRACFKQRFGTCLALEHIVQALIGFFIVEVLFVLCGMFQKLVDGQPVCLGKVCHYVYCVECWDGFIHTILWWERVVTHDVDVTISCKVVAFWIHREVLSNVFDDLINMFFLFKHCLGSLCNLGCIARSDGFFVRFDVF